MKKTTIFIAILSTFFVVLLIFTYASGIQNDISRQVLRLHIVANSNTDYDQQLKYAVRNRIANETRELFANSQSIEETKQIASDNIDLLQAIAQSEIMEHGFNYNVIVTITSHVFPATVYGDILFPAGRYDALKIVIENGDGNNWWCVLFPPLCFIDGVNFEFSTESQEILRENLSEHDYALITGTNPNNTPIQLRFRILDLFR